MSCAASQPRLSACPALAEFASAAPRRAVCAGAQCAAAARRLTKMGRRSATAACADHTAFFFSCGPVFFSSTFESAVCGTVQECHYE